MRIAILVKLLGVMAWIGGMFFAHACLHLVASAQLPPRQRLPLLQPCSGLRSRPRIGLSLALLT